VLTVQVFAFFFVLRISLFPLFPFILELYCYSLVITARYPVVFLLPFFLHPAGVGMDAARPGSPRREPAHRTRRAAASAAPHATPASAALPVGPHQWNTAEVVNWLKTVKADVGKRSTIFEKKGWTKEELTKWHADLDASFAAAQSKLESLKITGPDIAKWDITSDAPWDDNLGVSNAYHRAALWAQWKLALRNFQK